MCPFLNKSDCRCAQHLTFGNLFSAFAECANKFNACRIYDEMLTEQAKPDHYRSARFQGKILVAS